MPQAQGPTTGQKKACRRSVGRDFDLSARGKAVRTSLRGATPWVVGTLRKKVETDNGPTLSVRAVECPSRWSADDHRRGCTVRLGKQTPCRYSFTTFAHRT